MDYSKWFSPHKEAREALLPEERERVPEGQISIDPALLPFCIPEYQQAYEWIDEAILYGNIPLLETFPIGRIERDGWNFVLTDKEVRSEPVLTWKLPTSEMGPELTQNEITYPGWVLTAKGVHRWLEKLLDSAPQSQEVEGPKHPEIILTNKEPMFRAGCKIQGMETDSSGSSSMVMQVDNRYVSPTAAHLFTRVGEQVAIEINGKWYHMGYVEKFLPDVDMALISIEPTH
jgi:hypothetical protein